MMMDFHHHACLCEILLRSHVCNTDRRTEFAHLLCLLTYFLGKLWTLQDYFSHYLLNFQNSTGAQRRIFEIQDPESSNQVNIQSIIPSIDPSKKAESIL